MLVKELHKLLNSNESFNRKLKIVDDVYKCSELALEHKEVFLLTWIIEHSDQDFMKTWTCINSWLKSEQFKKLNKNDISREEFINIIKLIHNKLPMEIIEDSTLATILESIVLLIENEVFQHYFKYNVDVYCKLISYMLQKIESDVYLKGFLKTELFKRNLIDNEKFHKNFISIVLPTLTECLKKFDCNEIFDQISRLLQKCLFYRNHKEFKTFINYFFEDVKLDKKGAPNLLLKYILHSYRGSDCATLTYKVIFHAFCLAYDADFELTYKFFILLLHLVGFDLKNKFILFNTHKLDIPKSELYLTKSQEIILVLLEILSKNKNDLNVKVNNITFGEFIKDILKQLLFLSTPSTTSYKIFITVVDIDPLLIESITDDIIIYAMILNNRKYNELYEILIIHIFDIYSKLRRIENLISKMVHTLNRYFSGHNKKLEEIYKFTGQIDTEEHYVNIENIAVEDIFTDNILSHFNKCICNLASWQVINVFKTLLYQLRHVLDVIDNNEQGIHFLAIMSVLLGTFLSSIRIAEHTVVANVIEKSLKELEELRNILQQFGLILLNREHNQKLMRSFLNLAYNWAEIHIILEYYSISGGIQVNKMIDSNYTACNITYLHSYLTVKQWCLISERITNFGEVACKQLLEKLHIQKIRAMLLFEKSIHKDILQNVIKSFSVNVEIMWRDILEDRYLINLLPKMDPCTAMFLAEKVVDNTNTFKAIHKTHITDSCLFITAINCVIITKINKLLTKKKNKIHINKATNIKISAVFTEDIVSSNESKEIIETVKSLYYSNPSDHENGWYINEDKMHSLFQMLEMYPVISCSDTVQKLHLIYFSSLHRDLSSEFKQGNYKKIQKDCEKLITGILQHSKFKLTDLFRTENLCKDIVENYDEWKHIFSLVTENIFKNEYSIGTYEAVILDFTKRLPEPVYTCCCVIIINIINKMKKLKMAKNIKNVAEQYKSTICDKVLDAVLQNKPTPILINGYAEILKHFLLNNEEEKLVKLLSTLNSYIDIALSDAEDVDVMLFITVLENKAKMRSIINDDFSLKVWNACKQKHWIYSGTDKYAQLVKIIFGLVTNEEFSTIVTDLFEITVESITKRKYEMCAKKFKIWELVLSCNLNSVKNKIIQSALEKLLEKFIIILQYSELYNNLYESVFSLENAIIHSHLPLTPLMIDILLLSVNLLCDGHLEDKSIFNLSATVLESLLKYRKPIIMDRLPSFLQLYRLLLKSLCKKSNSDLNEEIRIKEASDQSHLLEKLTKNLVLCQKDMARIAMYLISDILQQYEQVTFHPNIKIHLNNCIYSLLTICDQHAISFLMRSLSSASTEIFKDLFDSYKKFYRFTGKV